MKRQISIAKRDQTRAARRSQRMNGLLREELEETQRFWACVGHDVSNLLEAVVGNAEVLRERLRTDPEACLIVDAILRAGEVAGNWVKRPLIAPQARGADAPRASLNGVLRQIESLLPLLSREAIQVDLQYAPEEVSVDADSAQAIRVILNLFMNARDAMPEGGRLVLRVDQVCLDDAAGGSPGRRGAFGRITVSDTGVGLDNAPAPFDFAYSTKPGHLGLGLSTVRRLTEVNGGFIECSSEAGKGTTFLVYFPCSSEIRITPARGSIPPTALRAHSAQPIGAGSSKAGARTSRSAGGCRAHAAARILVVEDDALVREILSRSLASAGYEVLEAASAEQALEVYRRQALGVDLVLTDVRMERMSGCELGSALRAQDPGVRILYVSGYPGNGLASPGSLSGFLLKPFKPSSLLRKVEEMLGTGRRQKPETRKQKLEGRRRNAEGSVAFGLRPKPGAVVLCVRARLQPRRPAPRVPRGFSR